MKVGIYTFPTDQGIGPAPLARAVEDRGFDALFFAEHTHVPVSRRTPFPWGGELPDKYYRLLDPFLALTAAAAVTDTLLLGTGVALVAQRDPIITAKQVATLDLLSRGRFLFGIGVGWNREEMENHGIDPRTRGKRVDELVETMRRLWVDDIAEHHGDFVDLEPSYAWPKPIQRPHVPLLFGGGPAQFPRIARFDAGWFAISASGSDLVAAVADLRVATGTETPVTVAHVGPLTAAALQDYADSGAERIVLELETLNETDSLAGLDDIVSVTHSLGW
jgi:probable F420-dependent oxidoreductase